VSGANTDEHSSTQSDPAVIIEIALLRRQLWGAEKALKSKDEELFNKDQEMLHIKIEGAKRERKAEAMGRRDESDKYKGLLNEQKEMYDQAIRDLKDRGVVKKKPLAAADSRGELRQRRFKSRRRCCFNSRCPGIHPQAMNLAQNRPNMSPCELRLHNSAHFYLLSLCRLAASKNMQVGR
jgi:hypothetical protein